MDDSDSGSDGYGNDIHHLSVKKANERQGLTLLNKGSPFDGPRKNSHWEQEIRLEKEDKEAHDAKAAEHCLVILHIRTPWIVPHPTPRQI